MLAGNGTVVIVRSSSILRQATRKYFIVMQEFCEFRAKCGLLWCYDWVSIPMVYTQVSVTKYNILYKEPSNHKVLNDQRLREPNFHG